MAQEQSSLAKLHGSSSVAAVAWKYIGGSCNTDADIYMQCQYWSKDLHQSFLSNQ